MEKIICIGVVFFSGCFALLMYVLYKLKIKKTLKKIMQMLDNAIDGKYTESLYDESQLSAVESKFNQYFTASAISAKRVAQERDNIKELVSDISHQTKTPISNILLYSQLLLEDELSEQSRSSAVQIVNQSEKLKFLIESLVRMSRLETGIISFMPQKNNLFSLLDEVKTDMKIKASNKDITISLKCDEAYEACFDVKWTKEAIANILDNAVKYTPSGGSISISTVEYELFYKIDVSDTGIGISKHEINKVFERFYRSKEVGKYEGVGIGLFLSREIISAQGGYIKIISEINKGSTFSIFLPKENK